MQCTSLTSESVCQEPSVWDKVLCSSLDANPYFDSVHVAGGGGQKKAESSRMCIFHILNVQRCVYR